LLALGLSVNALYNSIDSSFDSKKLSSEFFLYKGFRKSKGAAVRTLSLIFFSLLTLNLHAVEKAPEMLIEAYNHSQDLTFIENVQRAKEDSLSSGLRANSLDIEGSLDLSLNKVQWVQIVNFLYSDCEAGLSLFWGNAFYITLANGDTIWPKVGQDSYLASRIDWHSREFIERNYTLNADSGFAGSLYIDFNSEDLIIDDNLHFEGAQISKQCTKRVLTKDNFR